MTIIVGQQIMCRVTYVESFEMFYVQLDIEKADLVEETIANFDVAKVSFNFFFLFIFVLKNNVFLIILQRVT